MNNPNMYTNKQNKPGYFKYFAIWGIVALIIGFFIFLALNNGSTNSYTWNVNEYQYALTGEDRTAVEGVAGSGQYDDIEEQEAFAEKYGFDRNNITEVTVELGYMKSNVVVIYETSTAGKMAKATFEWSSYENNTYTVLVEDAIATLDSHFKDKGIEYKVVRKDTTNQFTFGDFLITGLPLIIMIVIGVVLVRSMMKAQGGNNQAFDFGKSKARLEDASKIRFSDVAGCEDEKEEMKEVVDYLKNPKKYAKAGARIPKGVILKGYPGTGKTLLAKAVAGEASVPFYYISGSDFLEMFVGVGASRVRDMFKKARMTAPCIVFIDEIDAIGRQRGTGLGGGHDEREQTLNQLLVEMDGFENNSGVIVLAATNRVDVLDPALLRPGRFDRQIEVSLPDVKGREEILKVHARNKQLSSDVSLEAVAKRTPGFSGAQLENVLNEAAILSVRENHNYITSADIDEAIDRVMAGPAKKTKIMPENRKKIVAYHESGHAVIGLKEPYAGKVEKITIIPRGEAEGYVLYTPNDDGYLQTKNELTARIVSSLAGRASEEIFFDDVTTGAVADIESATNVARAMVTRFGMSSLGPIKYEQSQSEIFLGRDYGAAPRVSGAVANEIDVEVRKIIHECLEKAKQILLENKDLLILIAEALLKYETITSDEIDFLVKYNSLDAYDAYKANKTKGSKKTTEVVEEKAPENPLDQVVENPLDKEVDNPLDNND